MSSFCTCSTLSLDYWPRTVSVSGDSFVVTGSDECQHFVVTGRGDDFVMVCDDWCLHIVTRQPGGSLQETHSVRLPQPQGDNTGWASAVQLGPQPQGWGWESAVQLPGPLYAVLDYAPSGRVVCVDREGKVRHTVYSQDRDSSPGYQQLYFPDYMTAEQCGRLLLADTRNHGVQLVSASGSFLQRVVTGNDDGVWIPMRLCQDADSGLLAVGHLDSDTTDSERRSTGKGTVSVFEYQTSSCH